MSARIRNNLGPRALGGGPRVGLPVIHRGHMPFLQDMDEETECIQESITRCEHLVDEVRYNIEISTNFMVS